MLAFAAKSFSMLIMSGGGFEESSRSGTPEGSNFIGTGFEKVLHVVIERIVFITFNVERANYALVRPTEDRHDYLGPGCSKGRKIARIGCNISDIDCSPA